jgi:hypothetical protein
MTNGLFFVVVGLVIDSSTLGRLWPALFADTDRCKDGNLEGCRVSGTNLNRYQP